MQEGEDQPKLKSLPVEEGLPLEEHPNHDSRQRLGAQTRPMSPAVAACQADADSTHEPRGSGGHAEAALCGVM